MTDAPLHFRVGARDSRLSVLQTETALRELRALLPGAEFTLVPMSSPGDQDQQTDLRQSAPDFFTRFLDDAVRAGTLDCAVHSAKDLPDPFPADLEWFWLPWREDPRDALVLRPGVCPADLPPHPVIGVSSERRDAWARARFPGAEFKSIRGTIGRRLEQLDAGQYDVLLMAAAALNRLGLVERITELIPLSELPPPAGQGYLAVTCRPDHAHVLALRRLFLHPVVFVGAGPGDPGLCTLAGAAALRRCEVCLYDALASPELLHLLPPDAVAVNVGKRGGHYTVPREQLDAMLANYCRQGRRVVRLKGGDPGVFGRLAQELATLDRHGLPYRVVPGVSSLLAATTGTGLLLTRRGVARGCIVATPQQLHDEGDSPGFAQRDRLPVALFMAVGKINETVTELRAAGHPATEPAAMIFGASQPDEKVVSGTLADIASRAAAVQTDLPGLLICGPIATPQYLYDRGRGALGGARVLLTCSDDLLARAHAAVDDYGGRPLDLPLIRLDPEPAARETLRDLSRWQWLALTSPAAARCFLALLRELGADLRRLPRLISCGPAVGRVLAEAGLGVDAAPEGEFSGDAMLALARTHLKPGDRVLRLRSDQAGPDLAAALATAGVAVTDVILYRNTPVHHERLPAYDAVFFASASAVRAYAAQWPTATLAEKVRLAIGQPTARALAALGQPPTLVAPVADAAASIAALAAWHVRARLLATPR